MMGLAGYDAGSDCVARIVAVDGGCGGPSSGRVVSFNCTCHAGNLQAAIPLRLAACSCDALRQDPVSLTTAGAGAGSVRISIGEQAGRHGVEDLAGDLQLSVLGLRQDNAGRVVVMEGP